MPEQKVELPFEMEFTAEEFERLSLGLIPRAMEDKWFIFFEEGWLHLHRSWTGTCIYQSRVERLGEGYAVVETWINQDMAQFKSKDTAYEARLLFFLISNLLLGRRVPFPLPTDLRPDAPPGLYQHHIAGTGYPETKEND